MVHHLLSNLCESCVLGQVGDIAVHLAVNLYVLHHILSVSLETAVEVVQVLYSAYPSCRSVEQFGGESLRDRVVALLLIARNEVEAVNGDHVIKLRNLVGRVLKVGVHCDYHIALCLLETAEEGRALAVVAAELDALHLRVLRLKVADDVP